MVHVNSRQQFRPRFARLVRVAWMMVVGLFLSSRSAMAFAPPVPCVDWNQYTLTPRCGHAIAYDSKRSVVVMFGGFDGWFDGQTWEWNGQTWTRVATSGPLPRQDAGMVFDERRGVTVLCGGYAGNYAHVNETWEWDGHAWLFRTANGPNLVRPAMTYDARRGVTVMFGGMKYDDGDFRLSNETWEWDGNEWSLVGSGGPPPRANCAMVYDRLRDETVLFGGVGANTTIVYGDTWVWDGASWQPRAVAGPLARHSHVMAYDAAKSRIVLFGGSEPTGFGVVNTTWEWDGASWTEIISAAEPSRRVDTAMVFDEARNQMTLFGGYGQYNYWGDTWLRSDNAWRQADHGGPMSHRWHSMAFDSSRGVVVLFGGRWVYPSGETWEYHTGTHAWQLAATGGPPNRDRAAMAFDSNRGVVVLFGGSETQQGSVGLNDTWEWDGTIWTPRATAHAPSPRFAHAMVFDKARGVVVLHGANSYNNEISRETWEYDGVDWTLRTPTGPMAAGGHAMAYDHDRGVTVLFGGANENGNASNKTWEWDGQSWSLRSESGPSARSFSAMAYDASAHRTILFGGQPDSPGGLWTWDGAAWEWAASIGPRSTSFHAMAFDPTQGVTVLDGGNSSNETWELRLTVGPRLDWITSPPATTIGSSTTIHVNALGTGTLHYQWRRDGIALTDGLAFSGANTDTLHISPQSFQEEGDYDVQVWDEQCMQYSNIARLNVMSNGDINGDGHVNVDDVLIVVEHWHTFCNGCPSDVTEDYWINVRDLLYVITRWTG